jgi:hypothetical protein
MIPRFLLGAGLAILMLISGLGSYMYLGSRQSTVAAPPQAPTSASPTPGAFNLGGTLFLTQSGAIYSLSAGRFHQLTSQAGWSQLAPYPGDSMLAVKRSLLYSDVYVVNRFGKVIRTLTHNTASGSDTGARHWSFYPHLSYNNKVLFMSYDKPKVGFDVPLSIWAVPLGQNISRGRLWTIAIDYTGGDVQPLPLKSGGLIYTKFLYDNQKIISQLWITNQPEAFYSCGGFCISVPPGPGHGRPLTRPDEDCAQPSLSPNGKTLAMICTHQTQESFLTMASFNGSTLGPRRSVIANQLVAQPRWAPDGSGVAYLAPAKLGAGFQLWFLPSLAYAPPPPSPVPTVVPTPGGPVGSPFPSPTPSPAPPPVVVKPIQITANLGLDATSPMVWIP